MESKFQMLPKVDEAYESNKAVVVFFFVFSLCWR